MAHAVNATCTEFVCILWIESRVSIQWFSTVLASRRTPRTNPRTFQFTDSLHYCTISFNSNITRHTQFSLTPPIIFSRFMVILEICRKNKKSRAVRIEWNGTVMLAIVWCLEPPIAQFGSPILKAATDRFGYFFPCLSHLSSKFILLISPSLLNGYAPFNL